MFALFISIMVAVAPEMQFALFLKQWDTEVDRDAGFYEQVVQVLADNMIVSQHELSGITFEDLPKM